MKIVIRRKWKETKMRRGENCNTKMRVYAVREKKVSQEIAKYVIKGREYKGTSPPPVPTRRDTSTTQTSLHHPTHTRLSTA